MKLQKLELIRFTITALLTACLTACSSSGSSGAGDGNPTNPGSETGVVNGYYVVRSTTYDEFDNITHTVVYEVDYERQVMDVINTSFNLESDQQPTVNRSIAFFDDVGRLERWSGDFGTTIYEFNAQGLLARYVDDYQDDEESTFSYNANGQLVSRIRTFTSEGNVTQSRNYSYEYDNRGFLLSGRIASTIEPSPDSEGFSETTNMMYTVDDMGRLIRRSRVITPDLPDYGPFTETDDYEYDANGNVISNTSSSNDSFWQRRVFEYEKSEQPLYNRFLRIFRYFP